MERILPETGASVQLIPTQDRSNLQEDCRRWYGKFDQLYQSIHAFDRDSFNKLVKDFSRFLYEANQRLPGSTHPAVKMYRKRREGKVAVDSSRYGKTSNPKRKDSRIRQRHKNQYQYELAQYHYVNRRRKAVSMVMKGNDKSRTCPIALPEVEKHFKRVFEVSNHRVLENYQERNQQEDIQTFLE